MQVMTLLAAIACLLVWFGLTFLMPAGLGIVHVLLGVGCVLLIRWWVLRDRVLPRAGP